MDPQAKSTIRKEFQKHAKDTGSSAVQVALLTRRIEELTEHLKLHKKDHSSRYGLLKMVSARRRLLNYMKSRDEAGYQDIIKRLKLRR
jgi:small subunit ribosomal protein S15